MVGVDQGVIVATETRSDGPWTGAFGCYGLDLKSGRHRWSNHGGIVRGSLAKLLGFIPGLTNSVRDTAQWVADGRVYTRCGRVLDVQSGQAVGSHTTEVPPPGAPGAPTAGVYATRARRLYEEREVELDDGGSIRLEPLEKSLGFDTIVHRDAGGCETTLVDATESADGYEQNFYGFRLHESRPLLFVLARDCPPTRPVDPDTPYRVERVPGHYRLLVVDWTTGGRAEFPLSIAQPAERCRIETLVGDTLLLSVDDRHLLMWSIASDDAPG